MNSDELRNVIPIGGLNPRPVADRTLSITLTVEIEVGHDESPEVIDLRISDAVKAIEKALPGFTVECEDWDVS
jgi:hypothetical protein